MPTLAVTKFLALNFTDSWLKPTPELMLDKLLLADPIVVLPESWFERFLGDLVRRTTGFCSDMGSIELFLASPGWPPLIGAGFFGGDDAVAMVAAL